MFGVRTAVKKKKKKSEHVRIKITYLDIFKLKIAWFKTQHLAAYPQVPRTLSEHAQQVKEEGRLLPP